MIAAKIGDPHGYDIEEKEEDEILFIRCKTCATKYCGDQDRCCKLCLGAQDCPRPCELDPSECKQSTKITKTGGLG